MATQSESPISNAGTRTLEQGYQDHLVAQRLPAWMQGWSEARIDVLNAALQQSVDARLRLQGELAAIEPIQSFVGSRLQAALAARFNVSQAPEQLWFRDAYKKPLSTYAPIRVPLTEDVYYQVPLLEATLRNFTRWQAGAGGLPAHAGLRDAADAPIPGISAKAFAGLCRELDQGKRYQEHLDQVLLPAAAPGRVKAILRDLARASMLVDAFKARHEQVLSDKELELVIGLCRDGKPGRLDGYRVIPRQLQLLGCALQQIVVLDVRDETFAPLYTSSRRVLVYIPGDPQGPWHAFDDLLRFVRKILGQRLREPDYQHFFSRFVRRRESQAFFSQVIAGYDDLPIWANIDLDETLSHYPEPLFDHLAAARMEQIKDDAATLIMPVASLDRAVQVLHEQRLQAEGWALLGVASLFVPALGTVLLAVTAWKLMQETFQAVDAWHEGASREALMHLGNVAKDLAIMAATAAGVVAVQRAWTRAWAVDSLVPARLDDGSERLWDGDITPFRVASPPREASRDALGVYRLGERAWVEMDGHCYLVQQRQGDRQWQLCPLDGHGPLLRHNGAGAWRVWSEQPAEWDDVQRIFRRLGGPFAEMDDRQIEQILHIHDLSTDQLRALHVYGRAPEANLFDSVLRVRLIRRIEHLHSRLMLGQAVEDSTLLAHAQRLPGASALEGEPLARRVQLLRRLLFQRIYEAVQESDTPATQALRRVFPGLHRLGAQAVLDAASVSERQRLLDSGRVPLRMAEAARASVARIRVVRAREALYLDVPQTSAHARVVLGMLDHLPNASGGPRLRVFEGSLQGPLLVSTEGEGPAFDLIRAHDHYQLRDAAGETVGTPGELFEVLGQAYDAGQRTAMGIGEPFAFNLRSVIARQAQAYPAEVEQLLQPSATSGVLRAPVRLSDGRLGYPLSGRGPGRSWGGRLPRSVISRLRDLYPSYTDTQLFAWLEETGGSGRGVAQELARLERQYGALNNRLNSWVREGSSEIERGSRRFFREAMRSCWQRRSDGDSHASVLNGNFRWSLYGVRPGALPEIPDSVNFDHVLVISLRNMGLQSVPDSFLRGFTNARILEMPGNQLTRIPQPLLQMRQLECLDLSNNQIVLDAAQSTILACCENLNYVNLANNPLSRGFSVNALPRLLDLHLANTQLDDLPHGVVEHASLRRLDVRGNLMTRLPANFYASRVWIEGHVQLRGNPLTEVEAQRLRTALQVYHPETSEVVSAVPERLRWMDIIGQERRVELGAYWDEMDAEQGSGTFFELIGGLRGTAEFRQPRGATALAMRVFDMLQAMHEDAELRTLLFSNASQLTCQDSVALRFGDLELQVRVWRAEHDALPGQRERALLRLGRQLWRQEEVDRIALQDIDTRRQSGGDPDEIEVMLAYRLALRADLDLPIQTDSMLYHGVSGVSAQRVAQARNQVLERETDERLAQSLLERDFWRGFLSRSRAARFDALNAPFHERLEALQGDQQLSEAQRLVRIDQVASERRLAEQALMLQMTLDGLSVGAEQAEVMLR